MTVQKMKKNRVIKFDSEERILKKARSYVESVETFFDERDRAIPLLLKAMKLADRDLKREIMLLLGSFAKEAVVWPLYDLMTDPSESEEIRHDAAIQLSVIGPFLKNPQALADRLQEEIKTSDAERRLHATFALGWRGNSQAAVSLIERLYDRDNRVQQTAVNALCNLRDDRVLDLLLDRLNNGSVEQKRVILFNLWRFHFNREKVTSVYLKYLEHENPDLRFDALVCLGPITEVNDYPDVYRKCLRDDNCRVRELALKRLTREAKESVLHSLSTEIEALLDDPNMKIKRAVLKILRKNKRIIDFAP
jgi:HEAT repeat protein